MVQAGSYFRDHLAVKGAYVWAYSPDLSVRRGEGGPAEASVGWVQPPGTPLVGAAFLRLYESTGDEAWLKAARDTAKSLLDSQLLSGGWFIYLETDPERMEQWCYRASGVGPEECKDIDGNKFKNRTVLDDNNTSSVLNFLIWLDKIVEGNDSAIRDAIDYGLKSLLDVQYPNGAWPVQYDRAQEKDKVQPELKASLPADWPRTWVKPSNPPFFILNDDVVRDVIAVLLNAERQFGKPEYLEAAKRGGDFLLKAQLPAPHRGWAQIYDVGMQPIWGRKFEPPAVTARESAGAIEALLQLYARTGEKRYLDGAKEGAAWLESVRLPDGRWARFYELGTNRPIYVNSKFEVTYTANDLPGKYSFVGDYGIAPLLDRVARADAGQAFIKQSSWPTPIDELSEDELEKRVKALVATQDPEGRWVADGWILSQTFADAIFALARYVDRK